MTVGGAVVLPLPKEQEQRSIAVQISTQMDAVNFFIYPPMISFIKYFHFTTKKEQSQ